MARVTKDPDVRRIEILDASEYLFNTKGFESTSLNDIANKIGIVKGTLYYYFKSKDEILNAIAEWFCSNIIAMANEIVNDNSLDSITKIKMILLNEFQFDKKNNDTLGHIHSWENIKIHQKIFILMVENMSPIFAKAVEQGVREGKFKVDHPLDTVQFIMAGYRMLLDPAHFNWNQEELKQKLLAIQIIIESSLEAEKGSFAFLTDGSLNS
jgi:AcrR family transcriptional regulator